MISSVSHLVNFYCSFHGVFGSYSSVLHRVLLRFVLHVILVFVHPFYIFMFVLRWNCMYLVQVDEFIHF